MTVYKPFDIRSSLLWGYFYSIKGYAKYVTALPNFLPVLLALLIGCSVVASIFSYSVVSQLKRR
jgi:hypothetical protein